MRSKAEIRREFKEKRMCLKESLVSAYSETITNHTLKFISDKFPKANIHLYLPIKRLREVDTFGIVRKLQDEGHECFTSVADFNTQQMSTVYLPIGGKFEVDPKGIPIPSPLIFRSGVKIDVMVMPLLAYDHFGTRLGYGFGYYDKHLSTLMTQPFKLGLSFFPPLEKLPSEKHDIKIDACISPEGLLLF